MNKNLSVSLEPYEKTKGKTTLQKKSTIDKEVVKFSSYILYEIKFNVIRKMVKLSNFSSNI